MPVRKILACIVTLFAFVVVSAEIYCRFILGLGDPPLSILDSEIDYMFKPNQDVRQLNNRQIYNEYGMRNASFEGKACSRVVLVLGDSVVNGGNLSDQSTLATEIVERDLRKSGDMACLGNVSAGSWGPGNMRAWLEKFGFVGARKMIVVLSSHDLFDDPAFEHLNPSTHPTEKPILAIVEAIQRYLPRYLPGGLLELVARPPKQSARAKPAVIPSASVEIARILELARSDGVAVCLVQHLTRTELNDGLDPANPSIRALFARVGVTAIDLGERFRAEIRLGTNPYRDDIHLSDKGQQTLALALLDCERTATVPTVMQIH